MLVSMRKTRLNKYGPYHMRVCSLSLYACLFEEGALGHHSVQYGAVKSCLAGWNDNSDVCVFGETCQKSVEAWRLNFIQHEACRGC